MSVYKGLHAGPFLGTKPLPGIGEDQKCTGLPVKRITVVFTLKKNL